MYSVSTRRWPCSVKVGSDKMRCQRLTCYTVERSQACVIANRSVTMYSQCQRLQTGLHLSYSHFPSCFFCKIFVPGGHIHPPWIGHRLVWNPQSTRTLSIACRVGACSAKHVDPVLELSFLPAITCPNRNSIKSRISRSFNGSFGTSS